MVDVRLLFGGFVILLVLVALGIVFILPIVSFSAFQPGSEAPLISEISLSSEKVKSGDPVIADWSGSWTNRNKCFCVVTLLSAAWYLDGQFVELFEGPSDSINEEFILTTWINGVPQVKALWQWQTLPYVFKMPTQGGTINASRTKTFHTGSMDKGLHTLEVRAVELTACGTNNAELFGCGTNNGICCLLQSDFSNVCAGAFGVTTNFSREEVSLCDISSGRVECSGGTEIECRERCCLKDWCGGNWCQSTAPASCTNVAGQLSCACTNGVNVTLATFESSPGEIRTFDQALQNRLATAETIASIEFEIVDPCPFACCMDIEGIEDIACEPQSQCVNGECVRQKQPCQNECCLGEEEFFDRTCAEGLICQENSCVPGFLPPLPGGDPIVPVLVGLGFFIVIGGILGYFFLFK